MPSSILTPKVPFAILRMKKVIFAKEVVVHELSSKPTDFWKLLFTSKAKACPLNSAMVKVLTISYVDC